MKLIFFNNPCEKALVRYFALPFLDSQPSVSWVPYTGIQPTADGKYLGGKVSKCFKKKNVNLPHSGNYLPSIYIVLGFISYLDIFKIYRRMCVGYMQILHNFIYIEDLSILGFWYQRGVLGPVLYQYWATAVWSLWNLRCNLHLSLNSGLTHFKDSMTCGCCIEQHRYGRMHCNLPVFLIVSYVITNLSVYV